MSIEGPGPLFCITGVVQGPRRDLGVADQEYRDRIRGALLARFPDASIFCPVAALHASFAGAEESLALQFAALSAEPVLLEAEIPPEVQAVRIRFRELVCEAAEARVMIAYVPEELSMGTAMEMWAANASGKAVVTISPLRQNLAILSMSAVIVETIELFEQEVAAGRLDHLVFLE